MSKPLLVALIMGVAVRIAAAQQTPYPQPAEREAPVVHPGVYRALSDGSTDRLHAWVFFTDKGIYDNGAYQAATSVASRSMGTRCLARRQLRGHQNALVDQHDLPVAGNYVRQVIETGAKLRVVSKWLNAASIEATAEQVEHIGTMPYVRQVRPLARAVRIDPLPESAMFGPAPSGPLDFYGSASAQLHQVNIPAAHGAGFTGAGIIIGILDTGFKRTHAAFNDVVKPLTVLGEWDFINDDGNTANEQGDLTQQHNHGTYILGTIGGYAPDTYVGGAYDASFYLAKTEDTSQEVPVEEDYYVAGLEWIEENGADMATSSLGYINWYTQEDLDGETAVTTIAVNIAASKGLVCCTAAGNAGHDDNPQTSNLIAPGDAREVITCGAVASNDVIASLSADGPTADGRIKPELLAQGLSTLTVSPFNDAQYLPVSGTSLSTPLVAAATALVIQAHPDWTVAQVRSAMFRSASDYVASGGVDPLFVRGYGIVDAMAAINTSFAGDFDADGAISLVDYAEMAGCIGGPGIPLGPECSEVDLDDDDDFDALDFARLQANFTGDWPF